MTETPVCGAEGCDAVAVVGGRCRRCYSREYGQKRFNRTPRIYSDNISYSAAHKRVAHAKGRAVEHACVDCPQPAAQWSYNNSAGDAELTETWTRSTPRGAVISSERKFSPFPADYSPRCASCHVRFDRGRDAA